MIQTRLFKNTFLLLLFVGIINWVAVYLYLYWTIWWFDMFVHFSAGACVAMASILFYFFYTKKSLPSIRTTLKVAIFGAIAVGVLWEIYELIFGITSLSDGVDFYLDTGSDLLTDLSGGIIGSLYAHRLLK